MLKIQVLGRGIIPRGLGLAPRREPFNADLLLIQTILASPEKFTVNMLHPETSRFIEVTNKNIKNLWEKYSDYKPSLIKPSEPDKKLEENNSDAVKNNEDNIDHNVEDEVIKVNISEEDIVLEDEKESEDEVKVKILPEDNTTSVPNFDKNETIKIPNETKYSNNKNKNKNKH